MKKTTSPKEVPFLMSTKMVEAILAGRKTQTRRIQNPQQDPAGIHEAGIWPKCQPGDLIYVREEHYAFGRWLKNGISEKTGRQKWRFSDETLNNGFSYQYPDTMRHKEHVVKRPALGWHKRPSMFMPLAAARIWLRCTGVRAERVQSISKEDIKAEGVQVPVDIKGHVLWTLGEKNSTMELQRTIPREVHMGNDWFVFLVHWAQLWIDINGRESWDANPWVWVYEFEVLSTTGRPQS